MARGFMADGMLGRLCRWMRLLGYDVTYAGSEKEDAEILRECESRGLFLLTRDRELSRRYRESMYLESDDWRRQLAQVMAAFPPERSAMFTRCPLCNSSLWLWATARSPHWYLTVSWKGTTGSTGARAAERFTGRAHISGT